MTESSQPPQHKYRGIRKASSLKTKRMLLGLSQIDVVAHGAAPSVQILSDWEQLRRPIPPRWVPKLMALYDVTETWIKFHSRKHQLLPRGWE